MGNNEGLKTGFFDYVRSFKSQHINESHVRPELRRNTAISRLGRPQLEPKVPFGVAVAHGGLPNEYASGAI
jgi:hypothetical protein